MLRRNRRHLCSLATVTFSGLVEKHTIIIWEVVLHGANWQLLLKAINLVQEQNDAGLNEPSGVANAVEKGKSFLHSVDCLVLEKKLVVF